MKTTSCSHLDLPRASFTLFEHFAFLMPALSAFPDGIKWQRCTKKSCTPVFFVVNELPPRLRFRVENMALGGIFFGPRKPDMNLYAGVIYIAGSPTIPTVPN